MFSGLFEFYFRKIRDNFNDVDNSHGNFINNKKHHNKDNNNKYQEKCFLRRAQSLKNLFQVRARQRVQQRRQQPRQQQLQQRQQQQKTLLRRAQWALKNLFSGSCKATSPTTSTTATTTTATASTTTKSITSRNALSRQAPMGP